MLWWLSSARKDVYKRQTMSNARKPYHQLSSCFVDTVPDSLDGIYRSLDNFAKVSKSVSYTHLLRRASGIVFALMCGYGRK